MTRKLSTFALIAITVSAIVNLRGLPLIASNGYQTLSLAALAALFFMVPSAYVSAQLSLNSRQQGGVYEWVKRAFGPQLGFVAIWMEWINNIVGFPATLASWVGMFYLSTIGAMPSAFIFAGTIFILLWLIVFYNQASLFLTSGLNILGAFATILITVLILVLGLYWLATDHSSLQSLSPSYQGHWTNQIALFVSFIGAFSGMQITGFHVGDVAQPKKQYPRALFISALVILIMMLGSSLVMALLVSRTQLNVIAGVEQMMEIFFTHFHLTLLGHAISSLVLIALLASFSAWFIGPARGMQVALNDAGLKNYFSTLNRFNMPSGLLMLQGLITSFLVLLFIFMPSIKAAFFFLIAITSQFTALMYAMIFAAGLKLIAHHILSRCLCILGITSCLIGFLVGMFAPSQINWINGEEYSLLIVLGDILIIAGGLVFARRLLKTACN